MVVDEFGREIPAAVARQQSPPRAVAAAASDAYVSGIGGGGSTGGAVSGGASSRPSGPYHLSQHHSGGAGDDRSIATSGSGPSSSYHRQSSSHSYQHNDHAAPYAHQHHHHNHRGFDSNKQYSSPDRHYGGGGGRRSYYNNNNNNDFRGERGGRSRGDSYEDRRERNWGGQRGRSTSPVGGAAGQSSSTTPTTAAPASPTSGTQASLARRRKAHPSERYVDEPMLCEFVWKDQQKSLAAAAAAATTAKPEEDGAAKLPESDAAGGSGNALKPEAESREKYDNDVGMDPKETQNREDSKPVAANYEEYRSGYCLNFVRSFFNKHLDDSWFRTRYSPLARKNAALLERQRSQIEARAIKSEMEKSLENSGSSDKKPCSFVVEARLGGGVKDTSSFSLHKRKYPDDPSAPPTAPTAPTQQQQQQQPSLVVPKSHVFALSDKALQISEIPPYVTDEQLTLALMDHCSIRPEPGMDMSIKIYSATPAMEGRYHLQREAFAVPADDAVRQDIVRSLQKATLERQQNAQQQAAQQTSSAAAAAASAKSKTKDAHVPRKMEDSKPTILELDVECSDPYGRLDYDDDGKGNAPSDGTTVQPRKATVLVSTKLLKTQSLKVMTAALSSKERFSKDKEAAAEIARALDIARQIPEDIRLEKWVDKLFDGISYDTEQQRDADILDVSIAYLRRVHLFSFYNGCTTASCIGDVLIGKHAASDIHLRLQNADGILDTTGSSSVKADETTGASENDADGTGPPVPRVKDMLVQRLDDSITKALENCKVWMASAGKIVVDEKTDLEASKIEQAEKNMRHTWLENHCMLDDDGRARCSFHSCHKLFKDSSFLHKHLLKKHAEFLRAEQAKCHDEYMMKAWDEEESRPVPEILVDCGAKFGLVPVSITGKVPTAVDPEPELWRREEERRKYEAELRAKRDELRLQQQQQRGGSGPPEAGGPLPPMMNVEMTPRNTLGAGAGGGGGGFVDVDDMKEEKVEMSFDDVGVPVAQLKKKKKKRKLL